MLLGIILDLTPRFSGSTSRRFEGNTIFRKVEQYRPNDKVSHPRRLETSIVTSEGMALFQGVSHLLDIGVKLSPGLPMAKAAFIKKKAFLTSKLDSNLRNKVVKRYIWSIALYGAETSTLRKVDQKYLESFETWCSRRMEKISWTDHVRNEEVLLRVSEQRNILHEIRKRKANWIGHILYKNSLLIHIIEGTTEGGRRRKQLRDDLMENRRHWKVKEEAPDRTVWRTRFGRGYGPDVRQST
jgi:hypothetical protein